MYFEPKPLPSHLVERGEIYKTLIYSNPNSVEITEIAILELGPGAKIPLHNHPNDSELYYNIETNIGEICMTGGRHELENTSNKKLTVLSIKRKPGPWIIP